MAVVYSLLGAVARVNQAMSRMALGGLRLNGIVIVLLCAAFPCFLFITAQCRASRASSGNVRIAATAPKPINRIMAPGELVSMDRSRAGSVTVTGKLTGVGLESTELASRRFIPLVDPFSNQGILVDFGKSPPPAAGRLTISGDLAPVSDTLRKSLQKSGGKVGEVTVNPSVVLDLVSPEWHSPSAPANSDDRLLTAIIGSVVSGILLALFAATSCMRHIVFVTSRQASQSGPEAARSPPIEEINLRVTGIMAMDGARIDRVFDFPADLAFLPSGELAIVGRTNGSARMADAHSGDLAGHWVSLVKPGSLERVESGRLYAGPMSRPSLRIHYKNAATGRPASSILSFPNEGQRAFVDTELRRPQPFQSAAEE